jgi:hypothetical protein
MRGINLLAFNHRRFRLGQPSWNTRASATLAPATLGAGGNAMRVHWRPHGPGCLRHARLALAIRLWCSEPGGLLRLLRVCLQSRSAALISGRDCLGGSEAALNPDLPYLGHTRLHAEIGWIWGHRRSRAYQPRVWARVAVGSAECPLKR